MSKKIRIYTFKHSNYGAVLQAYALQYYLRENYNADVKIVDYTTEEHYKSDRIIKRTGSILNQFIVSGSNLFHFNEIKRRIKRTVIFKKKYFIETNRFSTLEDALNNHPIADIYITGSDQVFDPYSSNMKLYYLGFNKGNGIKVAYAPSFGISDFTNEISNKIKTYLDDFDYISCRENVGAEYLSSLLHLDVPTVCDPTLLLSRREWENVACNPVFAKKYILVYEINGGNDIIHLAKRLAKEKGLSVVCITQKTYKYYKIAKQVYDAGPAEFLGWFNNAEYIITDSFHGTVFSWIFEKEFFYYLAYEATSSRAKTLLKHFNCEDRIVRRSDINVFDFKKVSKYGHEELPVVKLSKDYINSFMANKNE